MAPYKHLEPQLVQFFLKCGIVTLIDISDSCIPAEKGDSGHPRIQGKEEMGVISSDLHIIHNLDWKPCEVTVIRIFWGWPKNSPFPPKAIRI